MKRVINFVKGKREEKKENKFISPPISVEITNPAGQKIQSEDEHILGLQSGYGYQIDINGKDKNMPKLHKAGWQGNIEKVKVHLKKTDVNLVDNLNRTALHFAVAQGHSNVAWFLLNAKASLDIRDSDGMTPFLKAIECGNKECVNMLLERGADVNIVDKNGNNGLHLASKLGFFNIASLLLKKGANFDCSNNVGEFPLHLATEGEHRELVDLLLRSGAHVNVIDRDNRTPLMLAARYGLTSFVSLFLEHSASLEACDSNGWTAEDYALIGGHQQLAADLKVPGREQINKEVEQTQEASITDDVVNDVDSDMSDCIKNAPQTAEVEINAKQCDLQSESQDHIELVKDNIVEEEGEDKGDKKEDTDNVESPRSCVTPPPLQPPRSWDLIQAGMIDEKEVQRRSLTALGTLRSRRESFNENNGGTSPHSPHKGQGDFLDLEADEHLKNNISGHQILVNGGGDAASSGSEESLPMDKLPSTPECHDPRPKSRLERAPSVDLTEEDPSRSKDSVDEKFSSDGGTLGREDTLQGYEEVWERNGNINDIVDNIIVENNNKMIITSNDKNDNLDSFYDTGQVTTEISDQFLQRNREITNSIGYVTNEIYRTMVEKPNESVELISETQFIDSSINQPVHVSSSLDNLDDYRKSFVEIESSRSCNNLDDKYMALEENLCSGIYSSDTMTDVMSNDNENVHSFDNIDMSPVSTVVKRNIYREVHSLDTLDDVGSCYSNNVLNGNESKPINKRHARNKSVSVNSCCWSKSYDVLSKPSNIDKVQVDTKKIDAQLECYDEALRELAEVEMLKRNSLSRSSKGSYSSSERKSESLLPKPGIVNDNSLNKDKQFVNDVSIVNCTSTINSQHKNCNYFLKLNDNKDFKVNEDCSNTPVKIIDKSKTADNISSDLSDKYNNVTNFVEDFTLQNNSDVKNTSICNLIPTIESSDDISLQELPPPPPELTFNPNILSDHDNILIKDFLMTQCDEDKVKCKKNISTGDNNENDDGDDEETIITKEFEKSLYKLEKDLYNINTDVIKPLEEKLQIECVRENNVIVLPVECNSYTVNKALIPYESRNGYPDDKRLEESYPRDNVNEHCVSLKHDDDSSSTIDRSAEEESPKPPPRPKRSLRKGRSEGEMRSISGSKNSRSHSTLIYSDTVGDFIFDKSNWSWKKSESEAAAIAAVNEKSESDSELCERPLRRKRKILLAMRGVVAGSKDSDEDEDTSAGDPPFWLSTDKGGHFARQDTVVSMPQTLLPSIKQFDSKGTVPQASSKAGGVAEAKQNQNEGEKAWTSSEGETASASTPDGRHSFSLRSHHMLLKEHLQMATSEKAQLEELVAQCKDQIERTHYELADANQAIAARDDTIQILEEQIKRLEMKNVNALDENQLLKHKLSTQDVELNHLKQLCDQLKEERNNIKEELLSQQGAGCQCEGMNDDVHEVREVPPVSSLKTLNLEALKNKAEQIEKRNENLVGHLEEVMRRYESMKNEKKNLESQNIADIKKLQDDTLKWKEKYEETAAELERFNTQCRPRLEESEKIIANLKAAIQKLESDKKRDQENWKSKFMDDVSKTLEEVKQEYKKAEETLKQKIDLLEKAGMDLDKKHINLPADTMQNIFDTANLTCCRCSHYTSKIEDVKRPDKELLKKPDEKCIVCPDDTKKSERKPKQKSEKKKKEGVFSQFNLELTSSELLQLVNKGCHPEVWFEKEEIHIQPQSSTKETSDFRIFKADQPVTLESHVIELKNELRLLQSKTDEIGKQNERTKSELISKEDQITNLIIRITLLLEALGAKDLNTDRLKNALAKAEYRNEALKKQICECRVKINELTNDNQQIQVMEMRLSNLKNTIEQTKLEISNDESRIKNLLEKISTMTDMSKENSELKRKLLDQQNTLHEIKKMMESTKSDTNAAVSSSRNSPHSSNKGNSEVELALHDYVESKESIKSKGQEMIDSRTIDSCDDVEYFNDLTTADPSDQSIIKSVLNLHNYNDNINYKIMDTNEKGKLKMFNSFNPYAYFCFSMLKFDPFKKEENLPLLSSISLQSFNGLDKLSINDKSTELLYKRAASITQTSEHNDLDSSNLSSYSYNQVLPINARRSWSIDSLLLKKTNSVNPHLTAFLIERKTFQENTETIINNSLSSNTFNKGDNSQPSENEIVLPNSDFNFSNAIPSSSSVDVNQITAIEPQLLLLQKKLESESDKRQSLEMQVNKLIVDLQEKIEQNNGTNQKNVLSNENQELAVGIMRQQALIDSEYNLNEKISQINFILQQQMEEQDRLREHSEMQMKNEYELTRQKLLLELSRVQCALKAKEAEERLLREKCDKLTRDVERSAEIKRKELIERSYSINLAHKIGLREKELSIKQSVVVPPPPPLPLPLPVNTSLPSMSIPAPPTTGSFTRESLRAQLQESIIKHRSETNSGQANINSSNTGSNFDDLPETSSKR